MGRVRETRNRRVGRDPGWSLGRCPREPPSGLSHWLWGKASFVNGRRWHLSRQWTPRVHSHVTISVTRYKYASCSALLLLVCFSAATQNIFRNGLFRLISSTSASIKDSTSFAFLEANRSLNDYRGSLCDFFFNVSITDSLCWLSYLICSVRSNYFEILTEWFHAYMCDIKNFNFSLFCS